MSLTPLQTAAGAVPWQRFVCTDLDNFTGPPWTEHVSGQPAMILQCTWHHIMAQHCVR